MNDLSPLLLLICISVLLTAASCARAESEGRTLQTFEQRRDAYLAAARQQPVGRHRVVEGEIRFVAPDPGKHLWNNIFALLAADPSPRQTLPGTELTLQQMVRALVRFPNMFHFNADGPAAALMRHPGLISADDRAFLFRGHDKAIFSRRDQDNYNLFTSEGTENHIAMCRFSGYLLAQNWLADHPDDAEAQQALAVARQYILRHARDVYRAGTGEWNSTTYYGYQLRGMLTCFEFADDPAVREACRALIDWFATEMALKYVHGINAGAESRGGATRSAGTELDQIAWLWFGGSPRMPTDATNAVYAAISTYRPPAILEAVARKELPQNVAFHNSHPTYLLDRVGFSRESIWFGDGYAISCLYLPAAGMSNATQQFRPAKIVARGAEDEPTAHALFLNSNARTRDGGGRSPWEQWGHHQNVLMLMVHVPENAADLLAEGEAILTQWRREWQASFEERWTRGHHQIHGPRLSNPIRHNGIDAYAAFPALDGRAVALEDREAGVVILEMGDTFVAVRSMRQAMPTFGADYGRPGQPSNRAWLIDSIGDRGAGGLVLEVGTRGEFGSAGAFARAIGQRTRLDRSRLASHREVTYTNLRGQRIAMRFNTVADRPLIEPLFDWGIIRDPEQNHPRPVQTVPPFEQPVYPRNGRPLEGWGRIPHLSVDGEPAGPEGFLDFSRPWPVFAGPWVHQENGILRITAGDRVYQVDYSGERPVWTDEPAR